MNTNPTDIAELESILSLDAPINSSVMPRWQRKQHQESASSDRFIPNRAAMNMDMHAMAKENATADAESPSSPRKQEYEQVLKGNLLEQDSRILAFRNKAPAAKDGYHNSLRVLYSQSKRNEVAKPSRHIPSAPVRILDAPELLDDYYLNLLSWSASNTLAVALAQTVYLWDATTGNITELMTLDDPDDYISSVSWIQRGGSHLAIGTARAQTQLWDVAAEKQVRSMNGHSARVSALAWNNHVLTSASRDTTIVNHDVRIQQHHIATLRHHQQEVCGLQWSPDGSMLASGANDNLLCIWDNATEAVQAPRHVLTDHQAAVKALAWCPHERNLLATGGGTADRCIKFWNASTGALLSSVDTGSQVCALQWSPFEKELLSSHGYAENQLCLWRYPSMVRVKELKGHTSRVLHLACSPDGQTVVSAAADETLRFWNVFAPAGKRGKDSTQGMGASLGNALHIR